MWKEPTAFPVPAKAILLIAAGIAILCSPRAALPHSVSAADGFGKRSCLYVAELQKSVTARQRFLVALEASRQEGGAPRRTRMQGLLLSSRRRTAAWQDSWSG